MIFGAIVAGGVGSRMNEDIPKQFLKLGEKVILLYSIETFMSIDEFDMLYIGVHSEWFEYTENLIKEHFPTNSDKIKIVCGGKDRNDTIFNIINSIENEHGESDDNIIITHDAVRVFVSKKIIEENIKTVKKYGACGTSIPVIDTIIVSDNSVVMNDIPSRDRLYQAQTPQSFNINLLKKHYYSLSEDEKAVLTDACKILLVRGEEVRMVEGDFLNFKITTKKDYMIAQSIVDKIKTEF